MTLASFRASKRRAGILCLLSASDIIVRDSIYLPLSAGDIIIQDKYVLFHYNISIQGLHVYMDVSRLWSVWGRTGHIVRFSP